MYTLLLRHGGATLYLAPIYSITVAEPNDLDQLDDAGGCAGCGQSSKRKWTFKLHLVGNCSLASAWALYNRITAFMAAACTEGDDLILERQVQDEDPLVYKITKYTTRMVDVTNQYIRQRVLTIELAMSLVVWDPDGAVVLA